MFRSNVMHLQRHFCRLQKDISGNEIFSLDMLVGRAWKPFSFFVVCVPSQHLGPFRIVEVGRHLYDHSYCWKSYLRMILVIWLNFDGFHELLLNRDLQNRNENLKDYILYSWWSILLHLDVTELLLSEKFQYA